MPSIAGSVKAGRHPSIQVDLAAFVGSPLERGFQLHVVDVLDLHDCFRKVAFAPPRPAQTVVGTDK